MSADPVSAFVLCPVDDVPDGGAKGLELGEKPKSIGIVLLRRGNAVRGYLNRCPHRGLPLETFPDAFLDETGDHLICTNHGARFRVSDGKCVKGPCLNQSLVQLPVSIENGSIVMAAAPETVVELFAS